MTWHVWTDGSCQHGYANVPRGVRGWGGWAAIIEHGSEGHAIHGRVPETTNVRMELHAAIEGLRQVPTAPSACVLHTDCTTLIIVRDWWQSERLGSYRGADAHWWLDLAAELERTGATLDLLGRRDRGTPHRRAHAMAGAEARGGLRNLPSNALPIDDDLHRIRQGMRRVASRNARAPRVPLLVHDRGCEPNLCVSVCPVWLEHGPAVYTRRYLSEG